MKNCMCEVRSRNICHQRSDRLCTVENQAYGKYGANVKIKYAK
jgi:hypothetical protein